MSVESQKELGRILIVDDVPANVRLLTAYLISVGYEVLAATSGKQTLEILQHTAPDLVMLDVMMPEMNGFDVCEWIKSSPGTRHIPVILVTSLAAFEDKARGLEAGADDFITKPVNRNELLLRVKSLLRIKSLHDQLNEKIFELKSVEARLRQQANTDPLTGLHNKRYFEEFVLREFHRAERFRRPLSLVMVDIDHFKEFNDEYGHQAGDITLQQVASLFSGTLRNIDLAARYGGEEFVLVLTETGKNDATQIAELLRSNIENYPFIDSSGRPSRRVTISMGIATYPQDGGNALDVLNVADRRLYRAKEFGRNQVVSEDGTAEIAVPV